MHCWQLRSKNGALVGGLVGGALVGGTNGKGALVGVLFRKQEPRHHLEARNRFSWKGERSLRASTLVGDEEVAEIAVLINQLVDLDSWDEEQEQEFFESAVADCIEIISGVLPPPFYDLLHTQAGCLEDSTKEQLTQELIARCSENLCCPYLDAQDKRRTIRAVVWVLLMAMEKGRTLKAYSRELHCNEVESQKVVVEVFIEGAMDVFFDDDLRSSLIDDMKEFVPDVPFLPKIFEKFAELILTMFRDYLHDALKDAFICLRDSCSDGTVLPMLPTVLDGDTHELEKVKGKYKEQPFLLQLRRIFINKVLEDETKIPLMRWMPPTTQARWIGHCMDFFIRFMPGIDKIELTVAPFHAQLHEANHEANSQDHEAETGERKEDASPEPRDPLARAGCLSDPNAVDLDDELFQEGLESARQGREYEWPDYDEESVANTPRQQPAAGTPGSEEVQHLREELSKVMRQRDELKRKLTQQAGERDELSIKLSQQTVALQKARDAEKQQREELRAACMEPESVASRSTFRKLSSPRMDHGMVRQISESLSVWQDSGSAMSPSSSLALCRGSLSLGPGERAESRSFSLNLTRSTTETDQSWPEDRMQWHRQVSDSHPGDVHEGGIPSPWVSEAPFFASEAERECSSRAVGA